MKTWKRERSSWNRRSQKPNHPFVACWAAKRFAWTRNKIQVRWKRKRKKTFFWLKFITCSTKLLPPSSSELNRCSKSPNICLRKSRFSFEEKKQQLCDFLTLVHSSQTKAYRRCLIELWQCWQPNSKRQSPLYHRPLLQMFQHRLGLIFSQGQVYRVRPLFEEKLEEAKCRNRTNTHNSSICSPVFVWLKENHDPRNEVGPRDTGWGWEGIVPRLLENLTSGNVFARRKSKNVP